MFYHRAAIVFLIYLVISLWPMYFFLKELKQDKNWVLAFSGILTLGFVCFGIIFASMFFWIYPANATGYKAQKYIAIIYFIWLGIICAKHLIENKHRTIALYLFSAYFIAMFIMRVFISYGDIATEKTLYLIWHIDLFSITYILIALFPWIRKIKQLYFKQMLEAFLLSMSLFIPLYTIVYGGGVNESYVFLSKQEQFFVPLTLLSFFLFIVLTKQIHINPDAIFRNTYWIIGLQILLIWMDGFLYNNFSNNDGVYVSSNSFLLSEYGLMKNPIYSIYALFVQDDLNSTFFTSIYSFSRDHNIFDIETYHIAVVYLFYIFEIVIILAILWIILFCSKWLQDNWKENRLRNRIINI